MSAGRAQPKFHRAAPALRREALIEATLRSLKRFGYEGVSIRKISAEAGVSIGLINHHFPGKSALIALTYEHLALSLQESMRRQSQTHGASPRERLSGFFRASFAPSLIDPQLFGVWIVFWSMVAHAPQMRAVHDQTYRNYRAMLEGLLSDLCDSGAAPKFKSKQAAIGLAALLDGLWVELSLSPQTIKTADAIALCEDWVDALCAGGFARLRTKQK